ncbi:MAG: T4SS-associated protein EirA [Gammaproteobacteria bacterium]|nr:T4SS-associated protein EirA [Gammaproteobacteria bacterium]
MMKLKYLSLIILLSLSVGAYAASKPITKPVKNLFYCPATTTLRANPKTHTWHVKKDWKSYDISFVKHVKTFYGAQWNGANVGQIICVYHGENPNSFPIQLVFHTLVLDPNSGKWSKNLGGYKNCVSHKLKDCPFKLHLRPGNKNIYDIMNSIRNNLNQ